MSSSDHAQQASQSAEAVASSLASKKKIYVDPEVVRRRREEKAAKKAADAAQAAADEQARSDSQGVSTTTDAPSQTELGFKTREFVRLPVHGSEVRPDGRKRRSVKLMTWNMLAQALVRRTLFPGCDILKWKDRGEVLSQVVPHYSPDIACLQEVDKFDEFHKDNLSQAGYDTEYTTGYLTKLHGLCIAWKRDRFVEAGERVLKLDDAEISEGRTGCSRVTRNIGLLVALKFKEGSEDRSEGVIAVTHHLFWHARHQYERARQVTLLLREIHSFRESDPKWKDWPVFFAGDFNIQPSEGTYRLLTGASLSSEQEENLRISSVVHSSLDAYKRRQAEATASESGPDDGQEVKEDDDGEPATNGEEYAQPEGDDDRVLKHTRAARQSDGLLSLQEMRDLYAAYANGVTSVYGRNYGEVSGEAGNWFGERDGKADSTAIPELKERRITEGYYEPAWTNVTPLWRCTLDYIFVVPPKGVIEDLALVQTTHLLRTHRLEDLEPGLPRKGKEPSDHVPIMAEMSW